MGELNGYYIPRSNPRINPYVHLMPSSEAIAKNLRDSLFPRMDRIEPTYPLDFFKNNGWKKPQLHAREGSIHALYTEVTAALSKSSWPDFIVSGYLVAYIKEYCDDFSGQLSADWISFRITIGKKDEIVTPLNLIELIYVGTAKETTVKHSKETYRSLFFALISFYRAADARTKNPNYSKNITNLLKTFYPKKFSGVNREDMELIESEGFMDKITFNYRKVIAILDMFFIKFPEHPYHSLRISTLISRFMGCFGLMSAAQVGNILGFLLTDLIELSTAKPVTKELKQMLVANQEAGNGFGYFPYQVDLGIVNKSAYSISANPSLFLWVHTLGVMNNSSRSLNARFPRRAEVLTDVIYSAIALAFELNKDDNKEISQSRNIKRAKFAHDGLKTSRAAQTSDIVEVDCRPKYKYKQIAERVAQSLHANGGLTSDQVIAARNKISGITIRDGTVAAILKETLDELTPKPSENVRKIIKI